MRFQAGIIRIFRQAPQSRLDLRLQERVLPDEAAKRPSKPGRGNKLGHDSLAFAQAGDEAFNRLAFEFAGAKGLDGTPSRSGGFLPPSFNAALA